MSKVNDLKYMNIQKIRKCFYQGKVWTKNELAKATHLSLASTTNILQELLKNEEIFFIGENDSTGGRKSKQYVLNKDYHHILKVILKRQEDCYEFICQDVNLLNQIIMTQSLSSLQGTKEELMILLKDILNKDKRIKMMSLSIPGVCYQGKIGVCDFEQFENFDFKKSIQTFYQHQMILENDVNIASIGFSCHYPKCSHMILVYQPLVEYIGCGIIINGKLYNGFTHFAGELRFLPFYTPQMQDEMLKKNPAELLEKQLSTLCCVLNPEMIGVCSDAIDDVKKIHLSTIPTMHQPRMIHVKDLYPLIEDGLYQMSIKGILEEER